MNAQDNGGPAFPWCGDLNECPTINLGMTLRDHFAAKAMQAAATNEIGANGFTFQQRAEWAYMQADAMLVARKMKND